MRRILVIVFLLCPLTVLSQSRLSVKNRRAIEKYKTALRLYDRYDYSTAEGYLLEAVQRAPKFVEAYLVLTQIYDETERPDKAIACAETAVKIDSNAFNNIYFTLGRLYYQTGEYQKALENFERFISFDTVDNQQLMQAAKARIAGCKFAINAKQNPVPFEPKNVGPGINTPLDEYWPSLSADEQTLVYTCRCPKDLGVGVPLSRWQEDLFISRNVDTTWQEGFPLGTSVNTYFNEGAQSLTSDGRTMYLTICRGLCNIFVSQLDNNGIWSKPIKLSDAVNSVSYNEKQPSISPDGLTLYFVSNRPGGSGGYDVWCATRSPGGPWNPAKNLGNTINTPFDEQSPFIHFDNQTLYFSSNGHPGMGRQDIFVSRRDSLGRWQVPQNLGFPINTHKSEEGMVVNARGTTAYYSSDILSGHGRDIFTFVIPENRRPVPTSYFTGVIKDSRTRTTINANVTLVDLASKTQLLSASTGSNGKFLVCLPVNRKYALFVAADGFLTHSEHFDFKGVYPRQKPYSVEVLLHPMVKDEVMIMRNIFFATDSYELRPESTVELDRLVLMLAQNPQVRIEVGGHTDDQGTPDYNQRLSEQRAKAVAQYLWHHGIEQARVKWTGFGETKPIDTNSTEAGRAQNRRTEVKVL